MGTIKRLHIVFKSEPKTNTFESIKQFLKVGVLIICFYVAPELAFCLDKSRGVASRHGMPPYKTRLGKKTLIVQSRHLTHQKAMFKKLIVYNHINIKNGMPPYKT